MASKLERGFKASQTVRRPFSQAELEEYQRKFFTKDGAQKGHNTIQNFSMLRARVINAKHTGSVDGKTLTDNIGQLEQTQQAKMISVSLDRIFQHEATLKLFFAFASIRLVPESILFWSEVESLQNISWKANKILGIVNSLTTAEEVQKRAEGIWREFLSADASYEVCIPGPMLEEIERAIGNKTASRDIFSAAQTLVFRDMEKGLFREFLSTLNSEGLRLVNSCIQNHRPSAALATATALQFTLCSNPASEDDALPSARQEA